MIKVENLCKHYLVKKKVLKALNEVEFSIKKGETLGIVGESGSGKSTLAKTLLRLEPPTNGKVFYHGVNIFDLTLQSFKSYRQKMQIVFQDPYASLNPRMTIQEILEEPLKIHKIKNPNIAEELLSFVQMSNSSLNKYPHEFSGGQRQRIGIARALALYPEFLILDEPVSSLDVSIQAQIINLLIDLQKKFQLTYLFILHDFALVKFVSTNVAVMYLGEIVEIAKTNELFSNPSHPYTQALLNAVKVLEFGSEEKPLILKNELPSLLDPPRGCLFSSRCPFAKEICFCKRPIKKEMSPTHKVACHFA
jgi:oligopeptide/dipeptide ABC transporter ATP-binding protein